MQSERRIKYGLPLLRARSAFVSNEAWRPALIASVKRASLSWPDGALGSRWRYEVFIVPELGPPEEPWAAWPRQESDPLACAEVERQNTF
jgi:hypothetical protein